MAMLITMAKIYITARLTHLPNAIASAKSRKRICKSPDQDASEGGMERKAVAAIGRQRRRHRGSQRQEYLCLPAEGVIGIEERQSYSLDFTGHSGSPKSSCPDYRQRNPRRCAGLRPCFGFPVRTHQRLRLTQCSRCRRRNY